MTALQTIKVHEQDIPLKEYQGHRVVTFKEIDEVHGRPDGTARRNFNTNKNWLVQGTDHFKVCADEIRTNKILDIPAKAHQDIVLLTQTGYLMLVKSFTDKLAWSIQRELVDVYFQKAPSAKTPPTPTPKNARSVKMWKGYQVATLREMYEATNISTAVFSWRLRNGQQYIEGQDYFLLQGADFNTYKIENGLHGYSTRGLIVVTATGINKLFDALKWKTNPKKPPRLSTERLHFEVGIQRAWQSRNR